MRCQDLKFKVSNFKILFVFACLFLAVLCFSGCAVFELGKTQMPSKPGDQLIYDGYNQVVIGSSNATYVLSTIHLPEYAMLSRSKGVVASQGLSKKSRKGWFNAVAFEENRAIASRKYMFLTDKKYNFWLFKFEVGFKFNCEMVLGEKIFEEPYATDNARQIAILREVLEIFRADLKEVDVYNKDLAAYRMMVNQTLEAALVKLDASPVMAEKLYGEEGLEFVHMNLDKARIGMLIEDDVVKVWLRAGLFVGHFKDKTIPAVEAK